jgi:hypothetical protein
MGSITVSLSGCSLMSTGRVLYDQQGIRIGVEPDPTVSRSEHPVQNNHPANLTAKELESLLRVVQVSGWSGTLVGLIETPRPVPLFTPKELSTISTHLTAALHEAKPTERVFFSLPKPDVAYSEDRTAGALFVRGRYLHIVVTDHSSFVQADTGGGEVKDIRDTKGMKLWVARPAQAATVPDIEEPRWAPFETVHLSLSIKDVLASQATPSPIRVDRAEAAVTAPSELGSSRAVVSPDELQLQIRELTSSNLELRSRLDEQNKRLQALLEELGQLRLELEKAKSAKQAPRRSPSP